MDPALRSKTLLVNLFAGPGSGKSTTAAGVFALLKLHGVNAEYVPEYAKDMAWEGRLGHLAPRQEQLHIYEEQLKRVNRLVDKVDVIVTDSPLLLSPFYGSLHGLDEEFINRWVEDILLYDIALIPTFDVWVTRVKPYSQHGRSQTEQEARETDTALGSFLAKHQISMQMNITGDYRGMNRLAEEVLEEYLQVYPVYCFERYD